MKYYIQLEGDLKFRLQKDKTWRLLTSEDFQENDFLTEYESEIISIQKIDSKINLVGKEWKLNPTSGTLFEDGILDYKIYVNRTVKPDMPSLKQLISTIANGDDTKNNKLLLNTNGEYELIYNKLLNVSIEYPNIVVRNEAYIAGNGYVGKQASEDTNFIDDLYNESLEYWLIHLKKGITNMFSDGALINRETKDVINEINNLEI